jgi:hypothetical protein
LITQHHLILSESQSRPETAIRSVLIRIWLPE